MALTWLAASTSGSTSRFPIRLGGRSRSSCSAYSVSACRRNSDPTNSICGRVRAMRATDISPRPLKPGAPDSRDDAATEEPLAPCSLPVPCSPLPTSTQGSWPENADHVPLKQPTERPELSRPLRVRVPFGHPKGGLEPWRLLPFRVLIGRPKGGREPRAVRTSVPLGEPEATLEQDGTRRWGRRRSGFRARRPGFWRARILREAHALPLPGGRCQPVAPTSSLTSSRSLGTSSVSHVGGS